MTEHGLHTGTYWSVNVSGPTLNNSLFNSSTTKTIGFSLANGSYWLGINYLPGYTFYPNGQNFTVNGVNVDLSVNYTVIPNQYWITFDEIALPSGTPWIVIFNGTLAQTQTSTITVRGVNGTYSYEVGATGQYVPTPGYGNLSVNGANLTVLVSFRVPAIYLVSWVETGLTPGTLWQVYASGATAQSYSNTVTLNLTNGTYLTELFANPPSPPNVGYVSHDSPGNFTLNGSNLTINVTFIPAPYFLTFVENGLPNQTVFTVWITGLGGGGRGGVGNVPFDLANGTFNYTVQVVFGYEATPGAGNVTIQGTDVNITIQFTQGYNQVEFTQTGLPGGTDWIVIVNDTGMSSNNSTLTFPLGNGTYWYSLYPVFGYAASPANGTFSISGANVTIALVFASTANATAYAVDFNETGLPVGSSWSVYLSYMGYPGTTVSASATQITVPEQNGTYFFQVHGPPDYSAVDYQGFLTVAGTAVSVAVQFFDVVEATYSVTINESGLPPGAAWSVTLGSTTETTAGADLTFTVANGTYSYTIGESQDYYPTPSSGSVSVAGAPATISVSFGAVPTYTVQFYESGLPSGTSWSTNLTSRVESTTGTSLSYEVPNGTYWWLVYPVVGWDASPAHGTAVVDGASIHVDVTWTAIPIFNVTFVESGLPSGASWSATLGASTATSAITSITISAVNGTYSFAITGPVGYFPTPSNGSIVVSGNPVRVSISFAVTTGTPNYRVTLVESGLPSGTSWSASLAGSGGSSTTNRITFTEPNGTYTLNVTPVANYSANYSSPVVVTGEPISIEITFSNTTYPIVVLERGLPSGSLWTATVTNVATGVLTTGQSTATMLTLHLADGTYAASASGPVGYEVLISPTGFVVKGASSAPLIVSFSATAATTSPTNYLPYLALGVLVVIGLIAIGGIWEYRRSQYMRDRQKGQSWIKEWQNNSAESNDTSSPRP